MKISVIIPYHGEKNYIKDCLNSLLEQSYTDFEVVLVCDGCEPPELEGYEQIKIQLELLENECGVAIARNRGLQKALGEYVYFLDADDYLQSDTLQSFVEQAQEAGLVYGKVMHTWYSRKIYLDNGQELGEQNGVAEKDEITSDVENPFAYHLIRGGSFQSISALGILISKQLLTENKITWNEKFQYFSDLPFLIRILVAAKSAKYCDSGLYIKRRHNDPINLPSLLQKKDEKTKLIEGVEAYELARSYIQDDQQIEYLDYRFVRNMVNKISPFLLEAKAEDRKHLETRLHDVIQCLPATFCKTRKRHERVLIAKAKAGDFEGLRKKTLNYSRRQTVRRIMKNSMKRKRFLYEKLFAKMKMLDNTIIFESFFGKSYSDSPKYIFEYLNEKYPGKYKYIWINAGQKLDLPYKAKQMTRFSLKYYFYLSRCPYLVFNGRQPKYFIKRKGVTFLETWHGTPLKKLVFDMEDVTTASPLYKEQFYIQTRSWDYLVAPNQFSEDIFRHAFMYDGRMLETGYPRNDILYLEDKTSLTEEIKTELEIPKEKKVILYAPTWRDDEFYDHAKYKFTLKLDLEKMKRELGKEYVVLLRTHYFISDLLDLSEFSGFAYNVSKYDDIARLYLISDMLITDYSSVFFDYANLRRPMLFYTYDLDKYGSVLRGFYMDMEMELPGPMLFDTEQVIEAIRNIEDVEEKYQEKYEKFCMKYCAWEDGHASEKVVNQVFKPGK